MTDRSFDASGVEQKALHNKTRYMFIYFAVKHEFLICLAFVLMLDIYRPDSNASNEHGPAMSLAGKATHCSCQY